MKTPVRLAAVLLLLVLGAAVLALAAALQGEPTVGKQDDVGVADVARAVALLRQQDPRGRPPGTMSAALLSERDLDVILNQGMRRLGGGSGRIGLRRGGATLQSSSQAPPNPFGRWVNVEIKVVETGGLPAVESLRIGRLPVPVWLAERAAPWLAARAGVDDEWKAAIDIVRRVRFMPGMMQLSYVWRGDSAERMVGSMLPLAEQQRLRAYSDRLVELAQRSRVGWDLPLAGLLGPLFELARQRSAAGSGDAATENRAAILLLTLYANGRSLGEVLPAARLWPQPPRLRVKLAGREDSPLHFLISAAIAAEAGGQLSRVVGIYKEVADSQGGSGFSFNDLAADRAGTRFGELAVQDAQRLQSRAAGIAGDADFMPPAADLPENMPEAEFTRRFGGVGAPGYNAMVAEIDRRLAGLGIFR